MEQAILVRALYRACLDHDTGKERELLHEETKWFSSIANRSEGPSARSGPSCPAHAARSEEVTGAQLTTDESPRRLCLTELRRAASGSKRRHNAKVEDRWILPSDGARSGNVQPRIIVSIAILLVLASVFAFALAFP
jgi:hypothetical protein